MNDERLKELLKKFDSMEITYEEMLEVLEMMDDKQWKKFINIFIGRSVEALCKIGKLGKRE